MSNFDSNTSQFSETGSLATSTQSYFTTSHNSHRKPVFYSTNIGSVWEDQYELITNRYLSTSDFIKLSVASDLVTKGK